jgi:hypothetical protein
MAYAVNNPIRRIGPQNSGSPVLWSYADGDNLADIDASGYFNLESDKLQVGDIIFAEAGDGGGIFRVDSNSAGVVDCDNALSLGGIDSD